VNDFQRVIRSLSGRGALPRPGRAGKRGISRSMLK
jgi:hypothetical protein